MQYARGSAGVCIAGFARCSVLTGLEIYDHVTNRILWSQLNIMHSAVYALFSLYACVVNHCYSTGSLLNSNSSTISPLAVQCLSPCLTTTISPVFVQCLSPCLIPSSPLSLCHKLIAVANSMMWGNVMIIVHE